MPFGRPEDYGNELGFSQDEIEFSQEERRQLSILYARKMLSDPRLTDDERDSWEKELKRLSNASVKEKQDKFQKLLQAGGDLAERAANFVVDIPVQTARIGEEIAMGKDPFERLAREYLGSRDAE